MCQPKSKNKSSNVFFRAEFVNVSPSLSKGSSSKTSGIYSLSQPNSKTRSVNFFLGLICTILSTKIKQLGCAKIYFLSFFCVGLVKLSTCFNQK